MNRSLSISIHQIRFPAIILTLFLAGNPAFWWHDGEEKNEYEDTSLVQRNIYFCMLHCRGLQVDRLQVESSR
jgi:hypothetical protein